MYEGWNHHWCDEMEHWSNSMDQTRNWAAIVFCFEGEAWPWDLRQMPQFWWMFHLELDTSGATCMVINRWRWKCFNCLLLNWCQLFCVGSPILVKWSNVDGFHIRFWCWSRVNFLKLELARQRRLIESAADLLMEMCRSVPNLIDVISLWGAGLCVFNFRVLFLFLFMLRWRWNWINYDLISSVVRSTGDVDAYIRASPVRGYAVAGSTARCRQMPVFVHPLSLIGTARLDRWQLHLRADWNSPNRSSFCPNALHSWLEVN